MGPTAKEVDSRRTGSKQYKLADGGGVRLLVAPADQDSGAGASMER